TPATGILPLKQAIADHYRNRFGVSLDAQRIVITTGASAALLSLCALLVEPGSSVLMTDPGYPCNRHFVDMMGGQSRFIPLSSEKGYIIDQAALQSYWQATTAGVLLASPANPTGAVTPLDQLREISQFIETRQGFLIVDEIYQGFTYDASPRTVLEVNDEAFVVNSFSKYFGMTGWRLGWAVVPEAFVEPLDRLLQNMYLAPPTVSQYAALAAFEPECDRELQHRCQLFRERRDYLVKALGHLGFELDGLPAGAFYIYAGISAFSKDAERFCEQLLKVTGVAITPGVDFGEYQSAHHVRFAYTCDISRLKQAIQRLEGFLQNYHEK
ncbi:MAG: aminotransferase class I/II-fold pyridoxal phosphate-dependent enzyme, partial [Pseudomonadales bacterium]|nr:aminotransferase class I/II-fold pyridoxal phosphate-dependent enzyme [Pseudomonadales bacterium]